MEGKKLSVWTKIGYGVCDLGGNLFFTATAFVLMIYLTDTVKLAAGLAGTALMVGRLWDAFYDPVIGYISDKTKTRWGRRRPFMFAGAVPLMLAMALMFVNPSMLFGEGFQTLNNQIPLFLWVMVVYIVLCTTYSTVNIPYSSLTPELTTDYHERTSLNGYRFGFAVIGTLLGAGAALPIVGIFADKNVGFVAMGAIFGIVMSVTALITVFSVKEPEKVRPAQMDFFKTYLAVFKNKPYLFILFAYVLHILAITAVSGIAIYYFKYIHGAEAKTTIAILILLGTAMLFIPVSVMLSKKIGKKLVYGGGMVWVAFVLMLLFLFGHKEPIAYSYIMMFVMGIGFGFTYALPYAIVPDAIEYDYLKTGQRREGAFYGIWTWALKIGQAFAALSMGWVLSLMGYVADKMPQAPSAELGIRLFLGPIPAAVFVTASIVLYFYPINEKRYEEILAEIAKMEKKSGKK
ncbi:MAG: MFS transporter [Deltaproteobacteria bacterium]|nr:MFS transporter [Candidatus Zymogenaceae bacterium]